MDSQRRKQHRNRHDRRKHHGEAIDTEHTIIAREHTNTEPITYNNYIKLNTTTSTHNTYSQNMPSRTRRTPTKTATTLPTLSEHTRMAGRKRRRGEGQRRVDDHRGGGTDDTEGEGKQHEGEEEEGEGDDDSEGQDDDDDNQSETRSPESYRRHHKAGQTPAPVHIPGSLRCDPTSTTKGLATGTNSGRQREPRQSTIDWKFRVAVETFHSRATAHRST